MNREAALVDAVEVLEESQLRRFRPYEKYKSSGVEWLQSVPVHWRMRRLKYLIRLITRKNDIEGPKIGLENVESFTGRYVESDATFEGDGISFQVNDILYGKLRPYLGKVLLATCEGSAVGDFFVIRPGAEVLPKYLQYRLLERSFTELADGSTFGAKMPRVDWNFLGNLKFTLPTPAEQQAIAAFLDRETSKIDALVAKKRGLIEVLKEKRTALISRAVTKGVNPDAPMKPSGIDWLGNVPAHWSIKRLKFVARLQTGVTLGKKYTQDELATRPYLRVANVQDGRFDLEEISNLELPAVDVPRYELRYGDVLMTEGGDLDKLGRGTVWEEQIEGCLHQNHVFAVRPDERALDPWFLAALLSSQHGRNYFTSTSTKTTNLASTNSTKLKSFPVPLPLKPEQQQILDSLKPDLAKLDRTIDLIADAIRQSMEYRAGVVSAAVAGKIDVREVC